VSNTQPVRPLIDVWLRPRRVFRELATRPIGITDYLLAAAQGVASSVVLYRTQFTGIHANAAEILETAFLLGPIGGVVSIYLYAAIYGRLGARAGGKAARNQVFHVLAYGGIPLATSLLLWGFMALLIGDAAIVAAPPSATPGADADWFVALLLQVQFALYLLLWFWSVVLQVMGFSEIWGLLTRKAFAVWVLGQLVALFAVMILSLVIAVLFPGIAPNPGP
jgi:hypothetical protein